MSEPLTPERRAEIEAVYDGSIKGAVPELLAEIDRLATENARLSSAIDLAAAELEAQTKEIDRLNKVVDQAIECARSWHVIYSATRHPELAAELQRRGK